MLFKVDFNIIQKISQFALSNDIKFFYILETLYPKKDLLIIHRKVAEYISANKKNFTNSENFEKTCKDFLNTTKTRTFSDLKHYVLTGKNLESLDISEVSNWKVIDQIVDSKIVKTSERLVIHIPFGVYDINLILACDDVKSLYCDIITYEEGCNIKNLRKDLQISSQEIKVDWFKNSKFLIL